MHKTCSMIESTVVAACKKYKLPASDYNIILALIRKESYGRHVPGKGEWGMLQVVPWEKHIMRLTKYYKCLPGEKLCKCPSRGGCRVKIPAVTVITRRGVKANARLVRNFLKANPRAALYIGIGEMAHWKG